MSRLRELHDDEAALITSPEGLVAFRLLLPLIRDLVLYIVGASKFPEDLATIPDLKSDAALEKAQYRANHGGR